MAVFTAMGAGRRAAGRPVRLPVFFPAPPLSWARAPLSLTWKTLSPFSHFPPSDAAPSGPAGRGAVTHPSPGQTGPTGQGQARPEAVLPPAWSGHETHNVPAVADVPDEKAHLQPRPGGRAWRKGPGHTRLSPGLATVSGIGEGVVTLSPASVYFSAEQG